MSKTESELREAVVSGSAKGFAQEITVGGHHLRADEPQGLGGTDTGPSPYDLLLSALGACTSMTVSLYARRKQCQRRSNRSGVPDSIRPARQRDARFDDDEHVHIGHRRRVAPRARLGLRFGRWLPFGFGLGYATDPGPRKAG
jgi:hypothetical protein